MKKIILIYLSVPIITLTANANNFHERVNDLRASGGTHNTSTNYSQNIAPIKYEPRRYEARPEYRYNQNNSVQARTNNHYQRPQRTRMAPPTYQRKVRISAAASRKFSSTTIAAKNGNANAQFDLAIMYANGKGVPKSEKKAFNWFHKAAKNNHAVAKHYMGISFLQGRGVKKQFHLAKYWFKLAKKQGYKPSTNYLNKLTNI